ncbi:MAG: hypothetical protein A3G11_00695 [Candidatus Lloydbacteria bacterium RIFCSPLOWO2_12_FULL_51_9]|uniref:Uncharacterized protein n=2 Tax=Candidatus Lloydiibacteriota TaxID=1817910 RepID=A0A1G2DUA0_9BACT|nr:MAG: hypothetical protein A3J08_00100 [Candidatus Lloydbacteria bacterium RIFCSPLOWO2_02_FULL_51_11]OGZ17225.1 MAG: hypothetical protein A3G11_00695 [Candidatus Lloydbacteria bacterium RIFCSPLOWO2_12_FULL_51_9]
MVAILDALHRTLHRSLEHPFFRFLLSILLFMSSVALVSDLWTSLTAPSVERISPTMWAVFALIHGAVALEGIRLRSVAMFYAGFILSATSIVAALVRG